MTYHLRNEFVHVFFRMMIRNDPLHLVQLFQVHMRFHQMMLDNCYLLKRDAKHVQSYFERLARSYGND